MAYLEITLRIAAKDRPAAAGVYLEYKEAFLSQIPGATSKDLLMRDEDIQVLHRFDTIDNAKAYLETTMFTDDIITGFRPFLTAGADVRIYDVA